MIKERILQLLEYKHIGKENFFEKMGMTSANFRGEAKKRPLNSNAIENILSEFPDLSPEWLLTGKGSMLRESSTKNISQSIVGDHNTQAGKGGKINIGNTAEYKNLISVIEDLKKQIKNKDSMINKLIEQQEKLISKLTDK
jgi:cellulase/cellobiase CelA1